MQVDYLYELNVCILQLFSFNNPSFYQLKHLQSTFYQKGQLSIFNRQTIKMTTNQVPPQRKSFPSRGIKATPTIHMEEKVVRDSQLWDNEDTNLWIVENKLYDLSEFAEKHPGGQTWIKLTKGQDITEHFIVHHLRQDKARQILKNYYVKDCKNKVVRFTFQKNGLYRRVKQKVLNKFTPQQLKDQTQSIFYAKIFLVLFFAFLALTAIYQSYLSAAVCSFLLIGMVGIGHNFVHHKENKFKYFFLFAGFTHTQWQIMHCLSHHLYPNLQIDYEAAAFQPVSYFLRTMPENHIFVELVLQVIYFFLQPLNMTMKIVMVPIFKGKKPDLWYGAPIFVFILFYLCNGSFFQTLKLYLFMYGLFGIILGRVLFCGHRLQQLWTQGAQKIQDFGEHTVSASNDTDVWLRGFWSYALTGGLNVHNAHHFFPTADHALLGPIMDIIKQTCKQMNIQYHSTSRIQCFKSLSKGLIKRIPWEKNSSQN